MNIGIYGGSFDPIHNGHIELAKYVLANTDLDEIWLMVSPLNPLKPQGYVASDSERLDMARLAVKDLPGIEASDFEFSLPIPSYTYNTLCRLRETYPDREFRLIIGGDNWTAFPRWRNPDEIISEFGVIVYPRPGESIPDPPAGVQVLDGAPLMDVSSTRIREFLSGKAPLSPKMGVQIALPSTVLDYIKSQNIYCNPYSDAKK